MAVTVTHLTLEWFRWADKVVIQNPSLKHHPSHIQRKPINPAHVLPVCLKEVKVWSHHFSECRTRDLQKKHHLPIVPQWQSFKWKPGILMPGLQGKDHFIIDSPWQHWYKLHQLQSKARKQRTRRRETAKMAGLEMSWAHILMGIWTPRCCCWKASATILASPSCSYWVNQTQFSLALDCCLTKATAGEREMGVSEQDHGMAGWKRSPAPGGTGQLPKPVLLQHHATEPNWPTMPTSEPKPTPRHAGQGEKRFCDCMSAKAFQTHPGWVGMAKILITLYINCTGITPCRASKATDQGAFI